MAGEGSVDWRKLFAAGIDQELDFFPPSVVEGSCMVKPPRVVFEEGILEWRDWVLYNGPWNVQHKLVFLWRWEPNLKELHFDLTYMHVWIQLYNVPLELFSKKRLSYIASAIDRPLYMDSITASRERLEYARVCIEISARTQIPDFIDMVLYDESLARIGVFVPWLPSSCIDCDRFGHAVKFCPQGKKVDRVWRAKTSVPTAKVNVDCQSGIAGSNPVVHTVASVVSSGTSLKPVGPTNSDSQAIIAGNNSVVHTASSENSGIVLKSAVPTDSADNLVVAADSNLSNVIGTNSVTVTVANGVHSKSSDVAIVGSDDVADLGSKLSKGEHVHIPPIKRGRDRPAKDGKFVGGGSKNKFDVLNSIDPENLMNVPSGNFGKKHKGTALGVSAIIQELKSKKKEHADKVKHTEDRVLKWAVKCQINILCLLETRVKESNSGGILSKKFVDWGFFCNYSYSDNGRIWVLCFSRRQLWNQLSTTASVVGSDAWLIGDDFNVILNMEESSNAVNSATVSDISDFQRCVEELGIFDHQYTDPLFTWSNKQQDTYLARKLDRVLINPSWFVAFPSSMVKFHAPGDSDHCPALVWFQKDAPIDKPKPFKLKRSLKELNMSHFRVISGQVQRKRDELQNIQLSNLCAAPAGSFIKDELEAGREFHSLEQVELLFNKQKTKVVWIRDGDQGTHFFHSVVANKRTCTTIHALYNQDGVKLDSFEGMSNESYNINVIRSLLDYTLPRDSADILIKDVSDAEIKGGKVGNDLLAAIRYCFDNSFMLPSFNATAVVLVPKVPNPNKGRSIIDNTLLAQELVRGYFRKNISPRCALKIDLQKAFDSLDWEFVGTILHALGLPEKFIGWIWNFITNPSYSIVLNGCLVGYFKGARGVRQGDPLSPYIFVLAMNVLSKLLNLAAAKGVFNYHPKCKKIGLTHLCFADDLLVFYKGSMDSIIGVQAVLDVFYTMSGLRLNASKCELFPVGISAQQCVSIRNITGFKLGSLPVRYLGVPLVSRKLTVKDCRSLIDKIKAKLNLWANKHLSFAGRLQLICAGSDSYARGARVYWRKVCLLKSEGGLGVQDIGGWNKACIVLLVRKLLANEGSLWVAWLRAYVIRDSDFWQLDIPNNVSWSFKRLLKARPSIIHLLADPTLDLSARRIWDNMRIKEANVRWQHLVCNWDGELAWAIHFLKGKPLIVKVLKLAWTSNIYYTWKERNNRLFGSSFRSVEAVLQDIKERVRIQLAGKPINRADSRNATLCASWGIS
ncbi:uncharacterized protein LOC120190158 [Hibiscus syriacus]|uniref:uncharacterized protein LOC120190158 n=1 Tax=Hibiscus syriacus TaxID=106335 RepID=UPI00192398F9|nr:uncharacterized protein LOC120190158 [Hibiscus syriacus]